MGYNNKFEPCREERYFLDIYANIKDTDQSAKSVQSDKGLCYTATYSFHWSDAIKKLSSGQMQRANT